MQNIFPFDMILGRVVETRIHPEDRNLLVCQVDINQNFPLQLVTGVRDISINQLVIVCINKHFHFNFKGVRSDGSLLSMYDPTEQRFHLIQLDTTQYNTELMKQVGESIICQNFDTIPNQQYSKTFWTSQFRNFEIKDQHVYYQNQPLSVYDISLWIPTQNQGIISI